MRRLSAAVPHTSDSSPSVSDEPAKGSKHFLFLPSLPAILFLAFYLRFVCLSHSDTDVSNPPPPFQVLQLFAPIMKQGLAGAFRPRNQPRHSLSRLLHPGTGRKLCSAGSPAWANRFPNPHRCLLFPPLFSNVSRKLLHPSC